MALSNRRPSWVKQAAVTWP